MIWRYAYGYDGYFKICFGHISNFKLKITIKQMHGDEQNV